ncbi:XkdQ/YqbQ family protein [Clostridium beijerinckii]|jgi:hypothetical protein|uniref:XkdQ/YqbQ family protein n=1 Tax=Clostridium beijerinckii TaxID=1520 RepID=UPI001361E165|nr:XkdQ [Clostridium beijerinckii]MZK53682.1 XkdQ [Clostridium beijerinckii]MZK61811.1 XkdQ [Clostridium beijerinckii]MZK71992.1 XkdQ [Clostridium beijerinckii]MZK77385.1 XkdQ [Clostridium beijerinckii]MZK86963.1 XkdQ [Clostridium beijerinckii]
MELYLKSNYKIELLSESVSTKESVDSLAYTLNIELALTDELEALGIAKGDSIQLYDYAYGTGAYSMIFNGVIWDLNKSKKAKKISLTGKERTVYLEESESEYLVYEGETATQRVSTIAYYWNIPMGWVEDTKIGLSKGRRKESLYSMIKSYFKETAQKGGSLYRLRMDEKLDLLELGTNEITYELSTVIDNLDEKESLDGVVTQVKVLGKNENDDTYSPVIGVFKNNTDKYGTIQKIVQDEKIDDYAKAQTKSNTLFSTGEDSITINCTQDINTLRAGHKVSLYQTIYYVTDITHKLGGKGSMSLVLMTWDGVKNKFYGE